MITTFNKCYVLGASGFVGRHVVAKLLSQNFEVVKLNRPQYDLRNPRSLFDLDYDDSIIVDCATLVEGTDADIKSVVLNGPKQFTEFLASKRARYIYFSTSTVVNSTICKTNVYVRCKREMEKSILKLNDSTIVRLTFPFGHTESANRLISRLIAKALHGENLIIGDIVLPLTPIMFLMDNLVPLLNSRNEIINFTDGAVYKLYEVAETIYTALDLPFAYVLDHSNAYDFSIPEPDIFINRYDTLRLIQEMARTANAMHRMQR